jgi:hypothetical protein
VFNSFWTILGGDLCARVHPGWRRDQATSIRQPFANYETRVAEMHGTVAGFVNAVFNSTTARGST